MVPTYPNENVPISGRNLVLSDLDKAVLVLMYPRVTPHPEAPEWTAEHALSIVGIHENFHRVVIGDRSPDAIREQFVRWNKAADSLHYPPRGY